MKSIFGYVFLASLLSPSSGLANECTLDPKARGDFPAHNEVKSDLNTDGLEDYFYLAGEEDSFLTCVYLTKKTEKEAALILVHTDKSHYDSILDLDHDSKPELIVPSAESTGCSVDLISNRMRSKATQFYKNAEKRFEKFNFQYGMPEFYPVFNLFLLEPVRIYGFAGDQKVDVTQKMPTYRKFKREVIKSVIGLKRTPASCKEKLKKVLKDL